MDCKRSILTALAFLCLPALAAGQGGASGGGLGAWMNPDLGLVFDFRTDLNDVELDENGQRVWTTRGFRMSSAELSVGHAVDPYGRIDFNAYFSEAGAEIHELFFDLYALPWNLRLKGGHYLTSFGHWNRYHLHAMPFSSDPRILLEYFGGHLATTGVELSWLVPLDNYLELIGGIYNSIEGHTHDPDPASSGAAWGPDNPPPGCHFHGNDLHCPDDPALEEAYYALVDPDAPTRGATNKRLEDFAYLGRLQTAADLGLSWVVEVGASAVHQPRYSYSQRFPGTTYEKTVAGADLTVYWNSPEKNLYTGLDFGSELMINREGFEVFVGEDQWSKRVLTRRGMFNYLRWRVNRTLHLGGFAELLEPRRGPKEWRQRFGAFFTFNISHYQFVRAEFSRYEKVPGEDPVHMVVLQYDGVIGYHTHGRQR
jgi:hypothetical protein